MHQQSNEMRRSECNNQNENAILDFTGSYQTILDTNIRKKNSSFLLTRCKTPIAVLFCWHNKMQQFFFSPTKTANEIRIKSLILDSLFAIPYSNFLHQIFIIIIRSWLFSARPILSQLMVACVFVFWYLRVSECCWSQKVDEKTIGK